MSLLQCSLENDRQTDRQTDMRYTFSEARNIQLHKCEQTGETKSDKSKTF